MEVQINQIIANANALYGVGRDGVIYVYCGQKWGWTALNMTRMTSSQSQKKQKEVKEKYT